jgi:hypothetical protein
MVEVGGGKKRMLNRAVSKPLALIVVLSAALFALVAFLATGMETPITPDEAGYLSTAKFLVTGEGMNLSWIADYRFGQSILLAPAFLITDSPIEIYQLGLYLSCLATAFVPATLLAIARRLEIQLTWEVLLASCVVAVLPETSIGRESGPSTTAAPSSPGHRARSTGITPLAFAEDRSSSINSRHNSHRSPAWISR